MLRLNRHTIFSYCAILLTILFPLYSQADKISNQRLCADRECQTVISKARALARHKPSDPIFLSFDRGDLITIYSKSAGDRQDLWGGALKGKMGYFPRSFVREYKVDIPNPQHTVETEEHVPLEDKIMGRVPDTPKQEVKTDGAKTEQKTDNIQIEDQPASPPNTENTKTEEKPGSESPQPTASQDPVTTAGGAAGSAADDDTEVDETEIDETELDTAQETDGFPQDAIDSKVAAEQAEKDNDEEEKDDTELDYDDTEVEVEEEVPEGEPASAQGKPGQDDGAASKTSDRQEAADSTTDRPSDDVTDTDTEIKDTDEKHGSEVAEDRKEDTDNSKIEVEKDINENRNADSGTKTLETDSVAAGKGVADDGADKPGEAGDDTELTKEDEPGSLFGSMFQADGGEDKNQETGIENHVQSSDNKIHRLDNVERSLDSDIAKSPSANSPSDSPADNDARDLSMKTFDGNLNDGKNQGEEAVLEDESLNRNEDGSLRNESHDSRINENLNSDEHVDTLATEPKHDRIILNNPNNVENSERDQFDVKKSVELEQKESDSNTDKNNISNEEKEDISVKIEEAGLGDDGQVKVNGVPVQSDLKQKHPDTSSETAWSDDDDDGWDDDSDDDWGDDEEDDDNHGQEVDNRRLNVENSIDLNSKQHQSLESPYSTDIKDKANIDDDDGMNSDIILPAESETTTQDSRAPGVDVDSIDSDTTVDKTDGIDMMRASEIGDDHKMQTEDSAGKLDVVTLEPTSMYADGLTVNVASSSGIADTNMHGLVSNNDGVSSVLSPTVSHPHVMLPPTDNINTQQVNSEVESGLTSMIDESSHVLLGTSNNILDIKPTQTFKSNTQQLEDIQTSQLKVVTIEGTVLTIEDDLPTPYAEASVLNTMYSSISEDVHKSESILGHAESLEGLKSSTTTDVVQTEIPHDTHSPSAEYQSITDSGETPDLDKQTDHDLKPIQSEPVERIDNVNDDGNTVRHKDTSVQERNNIDTTMNNDQTHVLHDTHNEHPQKDENHTHASQNTDSTDGNKVEVPDHHHHHGNLLSELLKEELNEDELKDAAHDFDRELHPDHYMKSDTDDTVAVDPSLDRNTDNVDTENETHSMDNLPPSSPSDESDKNSRSQNIEHGYATIVSSENSEEHKGNQFTEGISRGGQNNGEDLKHSRDPIYGHVKQMENTNELPADDKATLAVFGSSEDKKAEAPEATVDAATPDKPREMGSGTEEKAEHTHDKEDEVNPAESDTIAVSVEDVETVVVNVDEQVNVADGKENTEVESGDVDELGEGKNDSDKTEVNTDQPGTVGLEVDGKEREANTDEEVDTLELDKENNLKFINEAGEIDEEGINEVKNTDQTTGDHVKEMEIKESVKDQTEEETDDLLNSYIGENLGADSPPEMPAGTIETIVEQTTAAYTAEHTAVDGHTEVESQPAAGDKTESLTVTEATETVPTEKVAEVTEASKTDTMLESTTEIKESKSTEDQTQETTAYVIDGTTFEGNYFDETTASQVEETPNLQPTATFVEELGSTIAEEIKPTSSYYETYDNTVIPDDNDTPFNENIGTGLTEAHVPQVDTLTQSSDAATYTTDTKAFTDEIIKPSETVKEESQAVTTGGSEPQVLGTSFGIVSQSEDEATTRPIDTVQKSMESQMMQKNETVNSNIVQEQVQPSLDTQAYMTDVYISRKPLSTEMKQDSTEAPTDTGPPSGQPETPERPSQKPATDQNNNRVDRNNNRKGRHGAQTTTQSSVDFDIPPPDTGTTDGYGGDSQHFRKVPDPGLDEEDIKTDAGLLKTLEPMLKALIEMLPGSMQSILEQEPLGLSPSLTLLVSMISTNILALFTCLGCVCGGKKKPTKKDPLVVIRELEEKLFVAVKEKENLEDDLNDKTTQIADLQEEVNSQASSSGTVETDLKTVRLHNDALKKQVASLQQEVTDYKHEVTEKSQQLAFRDSQIGTCTSDMTTLEQRAQDAELALHKTSESLHEREEEVRSALSQVHSLSDQLQHLETRKQQLEEESVDWAERVKDLTERIELSSVETKRMQEDLAFKENELEVLRDCFLQVKAFQGEDEMKEEPEEETPDLGEKLKQMMDVSRVNASLRAVEEERDVLQNKLAIEVESRKESEDQMEALKRRMEVNQTDKMKAERQCQEAQTKLEVLSKYFKEKEAELTRQLGEQEVLKNQNISKLESSDTFTQELSKENEIYRQQIEDLKTEISKAERDFRSQIAANEKKAHENWLATRAAERDLKEARHECGMLRQKLTDLERKLMQGPPQGLIRPITHRGMPPPGMLNGPPPPPERPGSRGDDDYRSSPVDRGDRRLPPGGRPPPPPHSAMSPPPYIRPPFPPGGPLPGPGDRRSPPYDRYPPPPHMRGPRPPFPRPPPPHMRSPPLGHSSEHEDGRQGHVSPPYRQPPPPKGSGPGSSRHQSQV